MLCRACLQELKTMDNNKLAALLQKGQPGQIYDTATGRLLMAVVTATIGNSAIVFDQEYMQHVVDRVTGAGKGLNIKERFEAK